MVVSTTQVEDWDESSSFLMERLLQALSLATIDRMSAEERAICRYAHSSIPGHPQSSASVHDKVLTSPNCSSLEQQRARALSGPCAEVRAAQVPTGTNQ